MSLAEIDRSTLTARIPQGWTLDSVAFSGPDLADDWQVIQCHLGDTYQVREDREGESRVTYEGTNLDAAAEHYLISVRAMTMEALGVAYPDGEPTEA